MRPARKLVLARMARPVMLLFVPLTLAMYFADVSFLGIIVWLLFVGAFGWLTACPTCNRSIYWVEERPYRTLLAQPHKRCTRCGFDFMGV
jgi:hypothetical protein